MIIHKQPLVSIITTFFNEEKLLERSLQSVKNQTYKNIELVLINDGSLDSSLEIAEKFKNEFDNCKIITIENSGHSEARNFGLKNATGEFLTFFDADDELEANMIEVCLNTILEKKTDLVISKFTIFNQNGNAEMVSGWKSRNQDITKTKDLQFEMFNHGISENVWAKLFKSSLAKQIVFEKGLWFDDRPFMFEYLFIAKNVSFLENSLLKIHKRESSITRRLLEPKRITDANKVFELELKIALKYGSDKILKDKIAKHYLSVLVDNYLIQIIEKKEIVNLFLVRKTFLDQVKELDKMLKFENIKICKKDFLMLKFLKLPSYFGWNFSNLIFQILKRKRIRGIKLLK